MNIGEGCCILCFKIIEFKKNSDPGHKYYDKNYKQTLFDCSNRLLGVQIQSSNTKFSVISCSPFCLTCFQSTEELWQIEEETGKTENRKELDKYVETFTGKILQCRLSALSKKLSSAENNDNDLEDPNPENPNLSFDQLDDKIESNNNDAEIKLEIKEEVDFIEETFALETDPADWQDGVDDLSTSEIFPPGANRQCSFEKSNSNHKLAELKSKSSLPELRVLLERLQFDAKGNILQKNNTNKRLRNKNQVNTAQKSFLVENSSLEKRRRKSKTELTLRYHDDNDKDFECSDENSNSAESEDYRDMTQLRNSKLNLKTRTNGRRKRSSLKKGMIDIGNGKNEKHLQCSACPSVFSCSQELDIHSKKSGHVNDRLFKCTKCSHSCYRKIDLVSHKRRCNYQSKKCNYCDTVCKSITSYHKHVRTHNEDKHQIKRRSKKKIEIGFQCAVCSSEFGGIRKFQEHFKETGHINIPSVQCTKCPKTFYNDSHLKHHDTNVHELYVRICPNCNKEIAGRFKYWDHLSVCRSLPVVEPNHMTTNTNPQKPFKCVQCNASFYRKRSLTRHEAYHLTKTNIQCEICFCFYKDKDAFEKHFKKHKNIKFECNLCDRNFKEFKHLVAHQITDHGLQSPFLCKHCKMTFSYITDLTLHLNSVHDENLLNRSNQPISCDVCGKKYKHKRNFFFHMFSHTDFSIELIKKYHLMMIKGSYQCEECGKIFTHSNSLNRHLKQVHSDLRKKGNFPCEECGKTFLFKCAMEKHSKRVHDSAVCDIDGNGSANEETLKHHKKRIHEQNKIPRKPRSKRTSNRELHNDNGISIGEIIQPTVTVQPQLVSSTIQESTIKSTDVIESHANQIEGVIETSTMQNYPSQSLSSYMEKSSEEPKETIQSKEVSESIIDENDKNEPHSTNATDAEQDPSHILKDVIETPKATLDNNCLQLLQPPSTTNTEPSNEELYENTFDDSYFEDTTADYEDHDDNSNDLLDSCIPLEHHIKDEDPFDIETSNNKFKSFHKTEDVFTGSAFRELRVLLERLQFDSEGHVINPMCPNTGGILRKRKAAILARTRTQLAVQKEKSLSGHKKIYTSRTDDDLENFGGHLSDGSEDAEENDEAWKKSATRPNRKTDVSSFRKRRQPGRPRRNYQGCVPSRSYKCTACLLIVSTRKELRAHLESTGHISVPSFECQKCPKSFFKQQHFRYHERTAHESRTCTICNDVCKDLREFKAHLKSHKTNPTEEKPFKCDKCQATFSVEKKLRSHKEDHLVETNVQCDICYLFYKNKQNLAVHRSAIHKLESNKVERIPDPMKFPCDYCDKSFSKLSHFIAHQISEHGMPSPFICKHCKNTFSYRMDLQKHLKSVHEEIYNRDMAQSCHFCGKLYKDRTMLLKHILKHMNVSEDILKKVQIIIDGIYGKGSFQCEDCGKLFSHKYSLKLHWKRSHAPDATNRTVTCNICGKVLSDANTFKRHATIHENKFQCEICGRNFYRISTLQGHIKRIHEQNKTPRKSYTRTLFPKKRS